MGNFFSQPDTLTLDVKSVKSSLQDGRFDDVIRQATAILDRYNHSTEKDTDTSENIARTLLYRAYAHNSKGYDSEALIDINAAFRYISEDNAKNKKLLIHLYLARSSIAFDLESYQLSYNECIKIQKLDPDDLGMQETLCKLYFKHYDKFNGLHTDPNSAIATQKNAYDLAENLMTSAIIKYPKDAGLLRTRAMVRIEKKQLDDAYVDIEEAIKLDAQYLCSYLIKAQIKYERQEFNEVITYCDYVLKNHLLIQDHIEKKRVLSETYCLYAQALTSENRPQEAKQAAQQGLNICTDEASRCYAELNQLCQDLDGQILIAESRSVTDKYFIRHMRSCWQCLISGAQSVRSGFVEPTIAKKASCWNKVFCCFGKTADTIAVAIPPVALISIIISIINDRIESYGKDVTKETCENIILWFAHTQTDADNFLNSELICDIILGQYCNQIKEILNDTALNTDTRDRQITEICNNLLKDVIAEKMINRLSAQQSTATSTTLTAI